MDTLNAEYVLNIPQVRQFLRELILESCGVDIAVRIPTGKIMSEYEQGKTKIAIDLLNYMIYDNPKSFSDMQKDINNLNRRDSEWKNKMGM